MAAKKGAAKKVGGSVVPKMEELVVDQAYLDAHPGLIDEGVVVGDTIEVEVMLEAPEEGTGDGFSIIQNGQYVRTYDDKALAEQYCSKEGRTGAVIVPESKVTKITVSYIMTDEKTGVEKRAERTFSTNDGEDFKERALDFAHVNRGTTTV